MTQVGADSGSDQLLTMLMGAKFGNTAELGRGKFATCLGVEPETRGKEKDGG